MSKARYSPKKKSNITMVLGGGVSGLAAALELAEAGHQVVLVEKSPFIGGAAASIDAPGGRKIPMGYHQIVGSDTHLKTALERLELIGTVSWKQTTIGTLVDGHRINLASPFDMLGFSRLSPVSRVKYLLFGARCLVTHDWSSWENRSVSELIRSWADEHVLREIFEPLIRIKFGFSPDKADAAWLGKRLSHGEGKVPFGYMPNTSWTYQMVEAFRSRIEKKGGVIIPNAAVTKITILNKKITSVTVEGHGRYTPSVVVSTLPPPALVPLLKTSGAPPDWLKPIAGIEYTSAYSLLAGVSSVPFPDYWTIFLQPRGVLGGCFTLTHLNETLATKKDKAVINLFTNVSYGQYPWTKTEFEEEAKAQLRKTTAQNIKFNWVKSAVIPFVSPVFRKNYQNPPTHLGGNLFLAGIYRTYPRLSSTGEAIADGIVGAKEAINYLG